MGEGKQTKQRETHLDLGGVGGEMSMSVGGLEKNGTLVFLLCLYLVDGLYLFFIDTKANLANKTKQKLERTNQMKPGKTYGGRICCWMRSFVLNAYPYITSLLLLKLSPTTHPIGSPPSLLFSSLPFLSLPFPSLL